MESARLRIYQDGECPFCRWSQALVERHDRDQRLQFLDYNDPAVAAQTPFPTEQLASKMRVRTPDGKWHAGFFGWVAVLAALPRWKWLARALSAAPLRWLGPRVYQFVADHRYRIPGIILKWIGAPPPCA